MKKSRTEGVGSYVVNGALACCVLYYAHDLSRSGRTAIDWIVMGLLVLAILWNIFKLGQRLYRFGRAMALWHLPRTLIFWLVGLFNTFWLRPEDVDNWWHLVGWLFIAVAALDTILLWKSEQESKRHLGSG